MNAFSKTVCMVAASLAAALPLTAKAHDGSIHSVQLSPAVVCAGDDVFVTVVAFPSDETWSSTSIDGVCFNHSPHSGIGGDGLVTEVFTITAPSLQGGGNVQVKAFTDDGCHNQLGPARHANLTTIKCEGEQGEPGEDGDDCTVRSVTGGAEICCGDTCVTAGHGGRSWMGVPIEGQHEGVVLVRVQGKVTRGVIFVSIAQNPIPDCASMAAMPGPK